MVAQPLRHWNVFSAFLFLCVAHISYTHMIYLYNSFSFWQFFNTHQCQQKIHDSWCLQVTENLFQMFWLGFDEIKYLGWIYCMWVMKISRTSLWSYTHFTSSFGQEYADSLTKVLSLKRIEMCFFIMVVLFFSLICRASSRRSRAIQKGPKRFKHPLVLQYNGIHYLRNLARHNLTCKERISILMVIQTVSRNSR